MNAFPTNRRRVRLTIFAAGLASLAALGSAPASARVAAGDIGIQSQALAGTVENVRCGRGCAIGAGVAVGVLAGAAIAGAAQNNRYYREREYYYDEPGPVYYGRRGYQPGYGRCWVEVNPHRGTGYWGRC